MDTPRGLVIVGRDIGRPLLITPERREEFVGAVPGLFVESRPALDESGQETTCGACSIHEVHEACKVGVSGLEIRVRPEYSPPERVDQAL